MREKYHYFNLECKLTEEELKECSKKLADAVQKLERCELEKKAFVSQKKAESEKYSAMVSENSNKVASGKEYRDVKCDVIYDWDNKTKEYIRQDTKEVCHTDIITERELQEEANLNAENNPVIEDIKDTVESERPENVKETEQTD